MVYRQRGGRLRSLRKTTLRRMTNWISQMACGFFLGSVFTKSGIRPRPMSSKAYPTKNEQIGRIMLEHENDYFNDFEYADLTHDRKYDPEADVNTLYT